MSDKAISVCLLNKTGTLGLGKLQFTFTEKARQHKSHPKVQMYLIGLGSFLGIYTS